LEKEHADTFPFSTDWFVTRINDSQGLIFAEKAIKNKRIQVVNGLYALFSTKRSYGWTVSFVDWFDWFSWFDWLIGFQPEADKNLSVCSVYVRGLKTNAVSVFVCVCPWQKIVSQKRKIE